MKKIIFLIVILSFCVVWAFKNTDVKFNPISWRKVETVDQAIRVMEDYIPQKASFDEAESLLSKLENDQFFVSGDTLIIYNSPFIPVRFLSLVSRTWMYRFIFELRELKTFTVKEGLLGP